MGEELIQPSKLACYGLLVVSDEMSQYLKITKAVDSTFVAFVIFPYCANRIGQHAVKRGPEIVANAKRSLLL
jgi:hypothetical protein